MKIIGLTGGTGSGKGVVSEGLNKRGGFIIDSDKIARDILMPGEPAYIEIVEFFGSEVLDDDKYIIRKKLGDIVFSDKEKLEFLNECTHKYIIEEIFDLVAHAEKENTCKFIVIDAPLLIEGGLVSVSDEVWVVYSPVEIRTKRIMERDNLTYKQALSRISAQLSFEEYKKCASAVIDNSGDLIHLENQLDTLVKYING